MKAERRHELQSNALAQWLTKTIEQIQPHINTILLVAVGLVAVIAAAVYLSGKSEASAGAAWEDYYKASVYEEVEQRITEWEGVATKYPGTTAGLWAKFMAADARLNRGTNRNYKDPADGADDLEEAQKQFSQLTKDAAALPKSEGEMLLIRSHWGLARTYESLAQSSDAIKEYELIAQKWPESSIGKAAAQQAEYLKGLGDWYEWYSGIDLKQVKPTQQLPQTGLPPGHPRVNQPSTGTGAGAGLGGDINLRPDGGLFPDDSGAGLPDIDLDGDDNPGGDTTTNPGGTEPETTEPETSESNTTDPAPAESSTNPLPGEASGAGDSPQKSAASGAPGE